MLHSYCTSSYYLLFLRGRNDKNYAAPVNSTRSNLIRSSYNRYYINYFLMFLIATVGTKIQEECLVSSESKSTYGRHVFLQYVRFSLSYESTNYKIALDFICMLDALLL